MPALHSWNLTPTDAVALQRRLACRIIPRDAFGPIRLVAGVDVCYRRDEDRLAAAACLIDAGTLQLVESSVITARPQFPYIPGLFSFRELPPVLEALARLRSLPDLIICDGHGLAHPRRFGLACHLGLWLDVPAIGCAKTRLFGQHSEPGHARGEHVPLLHRQEQIGAVLRTRTAVAPVYVSVGHRVSLPAAIAFVLRFTPRYRLPVTTRLADRLAAEALRPS